jgi:hypothetical protein
MRRDSFVNSLPESYMVFKKLRDALGTEEFLEVSSSYHIYFYITCQADGRLDFWAEASC